MRTFAYYLSQFHEIPENNQWWGKGFTEWTNVKKACPLFPQHQQPRIPAHGYYDLIRDGDVMKKQAVMAKSFGLEGWTFYYYHFSAGKRLLEKPIERFLTSGAPNIGFNLMWANETWSRRWNGEDQDILIEQVYDGELIETLAHDLARHFADPRYTRVNGKPLFLIYRPSAIPDCAEFISKLRRVWKTSYKYDVYLSGGLTRQERDPRCYGFDSAYEFPPHQIPASCIMDPANLMLRDDFKGVVWDYLKVVLNDAKKKNSDLLIHPCVTLRWDNTARVGNRAVMMQNFNYMFLFDWCNQAIQRCKNNQNQDERLLFINAWNEWAEGTYLEPDETDGYAALHVIKAAIDEVNWSQMLESIDDLKLKKLLHEHEKAAESIKNNLLLVAHDKQLESLETAIQSYEKNLEMAKVKISQLNSRITKLVNEKNTAKLKLLQLRNKTYELDMLWTSKAFKPLIKLEKKLRNH